MLGQRIAALRKQKGLSQYELAERLNFSRGKLANYEQGSRQPDYDTLLKIAEFFEVTVDFLLGRTDKPDGQADQKQLSKQSEYNTAFHDYDNLTEEEKEYLEAQLEIFRRIKEGSNRKKDK